MPQTNGESFRALLVASMSPRLLPGIRQLEVEDQDVTFGQKSFDFMGKHTIDLQHIVHERKFEVHEFSLKNKKVMCHGSDANG